MLEADIVAADELRRLANWNQTLVGWKTLLSLEPHGCFAAELNGKIIGTVTTTAYEKTLAWIGMMLVHPDYRGRGFARQLMQTALRYLQSGGVKCIKLDATPAGRPVYEKLGFVAEWTLTRQLREPRLGADLPVKDAANTRSLTSTDDWKAAATLDAKGFGLNRERVLRALNAQCIAIKVWPEHGPIAGFGMLRTGSHASYLAPLVCRESDGARALLSALLTAAGDRPVVWDVPDDHKLANELAALLGFTPQRPLTRMRLGPSETVSDPQNQLGIADPSLG